ncbi:MAG: hypothetical protein LBS50_07685 [Prevotellaceae bacterium]|jgi:hypothetical protein|nr:hypothetical protein [Prevotellaceae bacterium]
MKMNFTKIFTAAIFLSLTLNLAAQTVLPYKNGFESGTENSAWDLVTDSRNPANSWVIGTAVYASGTKGLYITSNTQATTPPANYNNNGATIIFAHREFLLPANDTYSIFFDFINRTDMAEDSLFICWVDNSVNIEITPDGSLPAWVRQTNKLPANMQASSPAANRTTLSFSVCGTGQPAKLVFVWKKHSANTAATVSARICIDNIQINKNSHINYYSGFDNATEIGGWVLQNKATCTNKWVIGSTVSITHRNALYISEDGEDNWYDGTTAGFVSAYKEFTLPVGEQFDIDFDWKCTGDNNDYMYVCWVEDTLTSTNWTNNNSTPPIFIETSKKQIDGRATLKLNKSLNWEHGHFRITGIGRPVKLVFFWVNDNDTKAFQSPAAVDNITITRKDSCPKPTDFTVNVENGIATISWTGTEQYYQLLYRNTYKSNAQAIVMDSVQSPITVTGLTLGTYTFMVRGYCENAVNICGVVSNDTSAWAVSHGNLVLSSEGCLDYWKLTGNPNLLAQSGNYESPYITSGVVNFGPENIDSRHTLHLIPEYDPRTDSLLRTIPDGGLASVRLGNWKTGSEAEALTYTFTVDPQYTVLVMQYAVVLQDPGHPAENQPKFTLEILNAQNQPIDPTCGNVNFVPGTSSIDGDTWHIAGADDPYEKRIWKEWTTVGLNLQAYAGQTLKVRLTTYDCSQSGHYGYAYLILDCAKGELEGLSCRNDVNGVCAPEGFRYCWYKKYNPNGTLATYNPNNCVSTSRCFTPLPSDTATYTVKNIFKATPSCSFDLSARLVSKLPQARGNYIWQPMNCENRVQMENTSIITLGGNELTEQPTISWLVTGAGGTFTSTEREPRFTLPNEGGDYNVRLVAGVDGVECADTINFRINLPRIRTYNDTTKAAVCDGETYTWEGSTYSATGIYRKNYKTRAGCDSIKVLDLFVGAKYDEPQTDTICEGDTRVWEGQTLTETGHYEARYPTSFGCDSVITMDLLVYKKLNMSLTPFGRICAGEPEFVINYANGGNIPTAYLLSFDKVFPDYNSNNIDASGVIPINLPYDIRPDKYTLEIEFINDSIEEKFDCKTEKITVPFEVDYPSDIVEQNWNDVLALLNPNAIINNTTNPTLAHTGNIADYTFREYQWYKGETKLDGQKKSYLYEQGGLEKNAQYKLQITRVGETYPLFTCYKTIIDISDVQNNPIIVQPQPAIARIYAAENGVVNTYSVSGIWISTQKIVAGDTQIAVPATKGIYILNVQLDSGTHKNFKIVVY